MLVPQTGLKGAFTFLDPFNKNDIDKKILEVTSIRRLSEMYANGDDPCNNIYIKNGLTKDDYIEDLQNDVPIAIFTAPGGSFFTIPCNKIESIPDVSGVPYVRKVIAVSLGALPYDYQLETLRDDINDLIKDKLATEAKVEILEASALFYKSYAEHEKFERWIETHPTLRGTKSYKVKYKELLNKYQALYDKYEDLSQFALNNYKNNIKEVNRPNEADLLTYTKKMSFEFVAKSLNTKAGLSNLILKLYNDFNEDPISIYGNSFTKVDERTYKGMMDNTPFTLTVLSGTLENQNIPDMFSSTKSLVFNPDKAAKILIEFDKAINIRNFEVLAYINEDIFCDTLRVLMYNDKNRLICNRVFNYHVTNGDFTPIEPVANSVNLTFGDFEDITDPLVPPSY